MHRKIALALAAPALALLLTGCGMLPGSQGDGGEEKQPGSQQKPPTQEAKPKTGQETTAQETASAQQDKVIASRKGSNDGRQLREELLGIASAQHHEVALETDREDQLGLSLLDRGEDLLRGFRRQVRPPALDRDRDVLVPAHVGEQLSEIRFGEGDG